MKISPFSLCLVTVLLWAQFDVTVKWVVTQWPEINSFVFATLTIFVAAVTLLFVAGPGRLGLQTLREPHTWAYSIILILMDVIFTSVLKLLSATEATLLARLSLPMILVLSLIFLNRKPRLLDLLAIIPVLAGCVYIGSLLDADIRVIGILLIALYALGQAVRTLITETHPGNQNARTVKERCRVTGYILLATSFLFLWSFNLVFPHNKLFKGSVWVVEAPTFK